MVPAVTSQSRVYAFSEATKRRYRVFGWLFTAIGFMAACFLTSIVLINSHGRDPRLMLIFVLAITAIPIVEGLIFVRGASRVSLILSPDTIEARGLVFSRAMRLSNVAGKRKMPSRGGLVTCLVAHPNSNQGPVKLPDDLAVDEAFTSWLVSLPDIDAVKGAEALQAAQRLTSRP